MRFDFRAPLKTLGKRAMTAGNRILVIGDSHTGFWSGKNGFPNNPSVFEGIDTVNVGPGTAFNLINDRSTVRAGYFIRETLSREKSRYGCIMLCFGEIDCRVHIIRESISRSKSITQVVMSTVGNYIKFIANLSHEFGIPILIWGPIPSTPPDKFAFNPGFPAVGSIIERNFATKIFNEELSKRVKALSNVEFISIFDSLIGTDFITRSEFLYDGVHLSNSALVLAEPELRSGLSRLGLLEKLSWAIQRRWPIASSPSLLNVAVGRHYRISSTCKKIAESFGAEPDGSIKFHTDIEEQPWVVIELDAAYLIDTIVVHNRSDIFQERARTLAVAVSIDGVNFKDVYAPEAPEIPGCGQTALRIRPPRNEPARFVKLYLRERQYFHLECVEILVPSFGASS